MQDKDLHEKVDKILSNDLPHIYRSLGKLEGKMYVLIGLGMAIFAAVWLR